jgi:flagellar protein FliO/FliZ
MSTARMLVQLVLALTVVLGLMWAASRGLRRAGGRSGAAREVVARRQISRGASVSVVRLGDRALVLGVTDSTVTMLADVPADEVAPAPAPAGEEVAVEPERRESGVRSGAPASGALAGSALSPGTWRTALEVLRERTARRG